MPPGVEPCRIAAALQDAVEDIQWAWCEVTVERPDELQRRLAEALAAGTSDAEISDLRTDLGAALLAAGLADAAVEQLELAVRPMMVRPGIDDKSTLDTLGVLGRALTEARRYGEAEAVLTDVVRGRSRVLGADDPQTLVARGNLLRAVGRGGRPVEALDMVDDLLADRRRVLGEDHPSTLDTRGHRAQLLDEAGRAAEAVEEMRGLLDDRVRVLGPSHPDVVSSRHNLAAIRSRSTVVDPVSAMWELKQNSLVLAADLGPEHPDTLLALGMVAEQAQRLGDDDTALQLLDRIIDARGRVLGRDAGPTITSRRMRCESLRQLGRVAEAAESAGTLVADTTAAFGPGAFETTRSRLELVESLLALSDASDPSDPDVEHRLDAAVALAISSDVTHLEPGHLVRVEVEALRATHGQAD